MTYLATGYRVGDKRVYAVLERPISFRKAVGIPSGKAADDFIKSRCLF